MTVAKHLMHRHTAQSTQTQRCKLDSSQTAHRDSVSAEETTDGSSAVLDGEGSTILYISAGLAAVVFVVGPCSGTG